MEGGSSLVIDCLTIPGFPDYSFHIPSRPLGTLSLGTLRDANPSPISLMDDSNTQARRRPLGIIFVWFVFKFLGCF